MGPSRARASAGEPCAARRSMIAPAPTIGAAHGTIEADARGVPWGRGRLARAPRECERFASAPTELRSDALADAGPLGSDERAPIEDELQWPLGPQQAEECLLQLGQRTHRAEELVQVVEAVVALRVEAAQVRGVIQRKVDQRLATFGEAMAALAKAACQAVDPVDLGEADHSTERE